MIFVRKTSLVDDPDMMDYEDDTSSVVMDFDHVLATMNATERLEFECAIKEQEFLASRDEFSATLRCPPSFDKISCWPASIPDSLVVIPCFSEFNGVRYDTTSEYIATERGFPVQFIRRLDTLICVERQFCFWSSGEWLAIFFTTTVLFARNGLVLGGNLRR